MLSLSWQINDNLINRLLLASGNSIENSLLKKSNDYLLNDINRALKKKNVGKTDWRCYLHFKQIFNKLRPIRLIKK